MVSRPSALALGEPSALASVFLSQKMANGDGFVKTLMKPDSPGKGTAPKRKWFRGLDSNQDSQIQSLVACQLADPGIGNPHSYSTPSLDAGQLPSRGAAPTFIIPKVANLRFSTRRKEASRPRDEGKQRPHSSLRPVPAPRATLQSRVVGCGLSRDMRFLRAACPESRGTCPSLACYTLPFSAGLPCQSSWPQHGHALSRSFSSGDPASLRQRTRRSSRRPIRLRNCAIESRLKAPAGVRSCLAWVHPSSRRFAQCMRTSISAVSGPSSISPPWSRHSRISRFFASHSRDHKIARFLRMRSSARSAWVTRRVFFGNCRTLLMGPLVGPF
jgi:hypothetical protein